jgi:hypothetical protein
MLIQGVVILVLGAGLIVLGAVKGRRAVKG